MKRILAVLMIVLMLVPLASCSEENSFEKWDGSVASSFASGDGSEESPFVIKTPAQLAYFAKAINTEHQYNESHIVLDSNIDLNNIPWTPIGTFDSAFKGRFNGKGHTIKNLKIELSVYCMAEWGYEKVMASGLFSLARDAQFKNLTIDTADISIPVQALEEETKVQTYNIGVLVGLSCSNNNDFICENIKVKNATLSLNNGIKAQCEEFTVGGIIGRIMTGSGNIKQCQAEVSVLYPDEYEIQTVFGGLCGLIQCDIFNISDCASYLDASYGNIKFEKSCYIGTIGEALVRYEAQLENIFSTVKINTKPDNEIYFFVCPTIGYAEAHWRKPDEHAEVSITNVFGNVKTLSSEGSYILADNKTFMHHFMVDCTENNSAVCEELPNNNGFDTDIWDISDMSHPVLK